MNEIIQVLNKVDNSAALLILGVLYIIYRIIKDFISSSDKKDGELKKLLTQNITAVGKLEGQILEVEKRLEDVKKLKKDLRRYYKAIKHLAGDKWPEISKMILEEEEFLNSNE